MTAESLSWRASAGAALALSVGCSQLIVLGDAENAVCIETGCGVAQSGSGGVGGSIAEPQAGSSPTPVAGNGGSASTGGPACQPGAADHSCDGLNEACEPTMQDDACARGCQGSYVQGSSYMSCVAGADFDQAEARCQANGMHLAKIDNALENATVLSLALDDYVWVGGSNRDDPNVFTWLDGTPFYSSGAAVGDAYENFGSGEPAEDQTLRCLQLRRNGSGSWSNWQCSGMQSFVCERY
jgi:Lectin C-type domain